MVTTWPRSKINFLTGRATIVCYPWGAGGKFLINCLGLARNACLQSNQSVTQQLMGDLAVVDKKVFMANAIGSVLDQVSTGNFNWNDLNLGANVLTGVEEESYIRLDPSTAQYWSWHGNISRLTQSDIHFFIDTHTLTHLEAILQVWKNANIVIIHGSEDFFSLRKFNPGYNDFVDYWQSIRGSDWPDLPPATWQEYLELPLSTKDELAELFDWEFCRFIQPPEVTAAHQQAEQRRIRALREKYSSNQFIELDGKMYLDWDQTLQGIEQCYDLLELEDLDSAFIKFYYSRWIEAIIQAPI